MKIHNNISFLCGCFKIEKSPSVSDAIWKPVLYEDSEIEKASCYYYPEFVEFSMQSKKDAGSNNGLCRHYISQIDKECLINLFHDTQCSFNVQSIEIFILPYDMMIFAVRLDFVDSEANDITAALSILRGVSTYSSQYINQQYLDIISPVCELYNSTRANKESAAAFDIDNLNNYSKLIENGNKLKLFQINQLDMDNYDNETRDTLLVELATTAPITVDDSTRKTTTSKAYKDKLLEGNKIEIFNNWSALSLFDTFTIVCGDVKSFLINNWIEDYFRKIYIHTLFVKFYLFGLNNRFRKDIRHAARLESEFYEFERQYCFYKISYNFLPLEIFESIKKGLDVQEEKELLYKTINQEKSYQEQRNDKNMNNMLIVLTCLTVMSTIWDSCCLFEKILPFSQEIDPSVPTYRLIFSLIISVIAILLLTVKLINKRR